MRGEGNVIAAREEYFSRRDGNLKRLCEKRFAWMNDYIPKSSQGADVGCGTGLSKEFIHAKKLWLTDYADHAFLDLQWVDAMKLPFRSGSLDFLIATNVVHHLPHPLEFFAEAHRILRSGGKLLLHEVQASLLMRAVLRAMRHEGYSFDVDVFDRSCVCTNPEDPWSGNNAIARLLFDRPRRFLDAAPGWRILRDEPCECLLFLNSGGVTAKTFYLPLPESLLNLVERVDGWLAKGAPNVFALGRAIALEKTQIAPERAE